MVKRDHFYHIAKNIIVNIVFLVTFVLLSELIIRVYYARKSIFKPKIFISKVVLFNKKCTTRCPYPYIMFKGKSNIGEHNSQGFRFDEKINSKSLKVAFFGGSTGYNGDLPIPILLSKFGSISTGKDLNFLNFSVVSSNHNQHLHSLLEQSKLYEIDLVVFYGGYNETIQSAYYDKRPGYPYNFDIVNESSPELQILYKNSLLFRHFYRRANNLKNKNNLLQRLLISRTELQPFSKNWNKEIKSNYFDTLALARKISSSISTGRCKIPFLAIYQPYNYKHPSIPSIFIEGVHSPIVQKTNLEKYYIDVSGIIPTNSVLYTDIVHLNQEGRRIVARAIVEDEKFNQVIKSCENKK